MVPAWIIAEDGAFICGDRASGVTSYSEPASIFAESAARAAGAGIAAIARLAFNILKGERARSLGRGLEAESDAANWHKINLGESRRHQLPLGSYAVEIYDLNGHVVRAFDLPIAPNMDAAWRETFGEGPPLICEDASEQVVVEQTAIWNTDWSRAKAEYLTAKHDKPFFYKLMPLSTGHLCTETRE